MNIFSPNVCLLIILKYWWWGAGGGGGGAVRNMWRCGHFITSNVDGRFLNPFVISSRSFVVNSSITVQAKILLAVLAEKYTCFTLTLLADYFPLMEPSFTSIMNILITIYTQNLLALITSAICLLVVALVTNHWEKLRTKENFWLIVVFLKIR